MNRSQTHVIRFHFATINQFARDYCQPPENAAQTVHREVGTENPAALTNPLSEWEAAACTRLGNATVSRNFLSSEQREQGLVATVRYPSWNLDQNPSWNFRETPKGQMQWLHT